jgi:hypothetical protein
MTTKFLSIVSVIALATISVVQAQSPSPAESPAASPAKHRAHKKAEEAASPAAGAEASASPTARRGRKAKTAAEASPSPAEAAVSPSPAAKRARKTKATAAAAAPAGAVVQATPARSGGNGLVWVNTETHIYHKEGSRFYGNTTHGKYVSEADAIKEGDRPAKGE